MERIWLKHYEPGVARDIDLSQYNSLIGLLEHSCEVASSKIAYANYGTELSFNEISSKSRDFAAYLINKCGIKKGDRVGIMMPNLLQYPIALFGILRAGGVVVNINPLYTSAELAHVLNDSGAKTIVILSNFATTLEEALSYAELQHIIVTNFGDMFPPVKKILANFIVKYLKGLVPSYHLPNVIPFSKALAEGEPLHYEKLLLGHDDMAFLQYTGGTTGVSKGAILTHGNMLANMLQILEWTKNEIQAQQQIMITPLPLYHIFSLTGNLLLSIALQAKNVLITNPRNLNEFINELKKYKFTVITGVNTLFNALLHHPKIHEVDFSQARIAIAGGMATQRIVAENWQKLTGFPLIEGYGLTEASPVVTVNPLNITTYSGSIGIPVSSTDVRIIDEFEHPVESGVPGELVVKGPQVMKGYWNNATETTKSFTKDGWLRTGDIATMDKEGFVYIVDRKKDVIIISGFNVFPNEVEDAIMHNPGVLEVAVVGVPHETTGEAVKAFIVKKDEKLTKDDIIKTCRQYLTRYKIPKIIEFREQLPKSNVGKILRRSLRE